MKTPKINFVGNLKKYIIGSLTVLIIGMIVFAIFGVDMDINFKGGSRFTYTYSGNIDLNEVEKVASKTLGKTATVTNSESAVDAGSSKIVISIADVADKGVMNVDSSVSSTAASNASSATASATSSASTDSSAASSKTKTITADSGVHEILEVALQKAFPKNKIAFAESNVIQSTIAKGFYAKSLVAVAISAVLVIVYVGFRFRKIGGISAAVFAWIALMHDVLIAFIVCVVFRLSIDTNFVAVVLTILGYSLNDTIIIYDRIRENRAKDKNDSLAVVVNNSINQTFSRTMLTSITTFIAVVVVAIVAECFGLTTLRSFAIPMSVGIISGSYSSICLAGPLWVKWQEHREKVKAQKAGNYAGNKKGKKA